MKSLAAAEADFRGSNDRDGNIIEDFWTADVSALYGVELRSLLQWERRDRRDPDFMGRETLNLDLTAPAAGRVYEVPGPDVKTSYAMESPSRGEGARAVDLRGTVRVVEGGRVWLDLKARMERIDRPGVEFDESVRGLFVLTK